MLVPFFSKRSELARRKGGGKSASSGKTKTSSVTTSSSSSSSSSSSKSSKTKTTKKTKTYSKPKPIGPQPIPAGQLFAGRLVGGGTREGIYGTRTYGSGYPGIVGRGTSGRGFPYFFWPLSWSPLVVGGVGSAIYLHNNNEYGEATNTSRPGGPLATAVFPSLASDGTYFRIFADNDTVISLVGDLAANCSSYIATSSPYFSATASAPYYGDGSSLPKPEQVVQYYRASTLALSLDGYNNTATYGLEGSPDSPLPSSTDLVLMDCLNQTIGQAAPLVDAAGRLSTPPLGVLGIFWIIWWLALV